MMIARNIYVVVVALIFNVCAAARAQDTCPGTCDLNVVELVCGADGITYQSSCLAVCQGVTVAKAGPCKARDAKQFPSPSDVSSQSAGAVDASAMNMFKEEGFSFVGRGKGDPNFKPIKAVATPGRKARENIKLSSAAVRYVLSTGHVYRTTSAGSALSKMLASSRSSMEALSVGFDPTDTSEPNTTSTASSAAVDADDSVVLEGGRKLKGYHWPRRSCAPVTNHRIPMAGSWTNRVQ